MEKDLGYHVKALECFLVEHFNKDRSAQVYVGTQYYRVRMFCNGKMVGDRTLFERTRGDAEVLAKQWIMEK